MRRTLTVFAIGVCASVIFSLENLQELRAGEIKVLIDQYEDGKSITIFHKRCGSSLHLYFNYAYQIEKFTQFKCLSQSKTDPEGNVSAQVGKNLEFHPNGRVAKSLVHAGIGSFHAMDPTFCDVELHFDENGNKIFEKKHANKCLSGRGIYRFFLPPGEYYVTEAPLQLRSAPNLKAKIMGKLAKDERVEVLDYTSKRLEIKGYYAPWAKVKTRKGEGWVYGGYIEPVNYGETYRKFFQNIDWKAFAAKMGLE